MLDTHALLWWHAAPDKLGRRARRRCGREARIGVSAMSLFEVGMLAARGRFKLRTPLSSWVRDVLAGPRIEALPVVPDIAVLAAGLSVLPDPADRLIVATGLHHACALVTRDATIAKSGLIETIWD